jgi:hypothetical protein
VCFWSMACRKRAAEQQIGPCPRRPLPSVGGAVGHGGRCVETNSSWKPCWLAALSVVLAVFNLKLLKWALGRDRGQASGDLEAGAGDACPNSPVPLRLRVCDCCLLARTGRRYINQGWAIQVAKRKQYQHLQTPHLVSGSLSDRCPGRPAGLDLNNVPQADGTRNGRSVAQESVLVFEGAQSQGELCTHIHVHFRVPTLDTWGPSPC